MVIVSDTTGTTYTLYERENPVSADAQSTAGRVHTFQKQPAQQHTPYAPVTAVVPVLIPVRMVHTAAV